jgi:hypothetical protein
MSFRISSCLPSSIVNLGDVTIGKSIFEPGWSWEKCVKPIAKTNSCQAPHTMYIISGRMKVVMDEGTEGSSTWT